jgi:hypothetical protein
VWLSLNAGNAFGCICLHVCYLNTLRLKYTELKIFPWHCRFGTGCLTLLEEHRLKMFERRVLRRVFSTKKEKGTGEWRIVLTTGLRNLTVYCEGDQMREDGMSRT